MAVMEPNNFEKKVQQKLDGLKIPPSDSVWLQVEKQVGKKKTSRKIVFIFFLLSLLLLSGSYWLFNPSNNSEKIPQLTNVVKKENNTNPVNKPPLESGTHQTVNDSNSSTTIVSQKQVQNLKPNYPTKISKANNKRQKNITEDSFLNPEKNIPVGYQSKQDDQAEATTPKDKITSATVSATPEEKSINENQETKVQNKTSRDSLGRTVDFHTDRLTTGSEDTARSTLATGHLTTEKTHQEAPEINDSSHKKLSEEKERHWAWGIVLSGGKSLLGNGVLDLSANPNSDYLSSPNMNAGNPNAGSGGPNPNFANPSVVNNSGAFSIGAFTEKDISKKTKIALGISYKYFSLINKIGTANSTQANRYNATNPVHSYRNNFHYLEFPAFVKFQLNNNVSLPLYWQGGFNISQLISSNALQYQSNPGLYYKDNSLFNKTQFGLNTGFSATLFAKQKMPTTIGPYFYYRVSKLADKGLYKNKHFSFIGIQAEITINKK